MFTLQSLRDRLQKRSRILIVTTIIMSMAMVGASSVSASDPKLSPQAQAARQELADRANRSNNRVFLSNEIDTPAQVQHEKELSAEIVEKIKEEKKKEEQERKKKEREERLARQKKQEEERRKKALAGIPDLNPQRSKVVAYALAQQGKPYIWAASGPRGFDCSGLMLAAWRQVGVNLYHNAAVQWNQVAHIKRSQLAPGDLVFYHNLGHVAMYIGNGKVIHAPQTGDVIRIASVDMMTPYGFGRPRS